MMMEKLVIARSQAEAKFSNTLCAVRYGNVLYSRGSVVPLFVDQISRKFSNYYPSGYDKIFNAVI